ncbi:MAG TPA: Nif3-like dinuclear metal center hexameric protein [Syntrophomonadaceae bacterium]|nr:Nif3-like dinuclear metal center hexameric protein [Syntrophomonadaceae bacterium]
MKLSLIKDITSIIEEQFPLHLAEEWDNSGLQIGSLENQLSQIIVALDLDKQVVDEAIRAKAELIITHHPMFMQGLKSINYNSYQGQLIKEIIKNNLTVYSAHTNLDMGENGLNDWLASLLGLDNVSLLGRDKEDGLIKLVVYLPISHINEVRQAINDAGSGHIGNYSDCTFRTLGIGTFKPGEATNPFFGQAGQLSEVEEYRLETVVYKSKLAQVLRAMHAAHPYEEVAYDLYELQNPGKAYGLGRMGLLPASLTLKDFANQVKSQLNLEYLRMVGDLDKRVKRVAVIGGSGASFIHKVAQQNVDVLVTGDVKYHEAQEAEKLGLAVIDAGHHGTEEIMTYQMVRWLREVSSRHNLNIKISPFSSQDYFKYI